MPSAVTNGTRAGDDDIVLTGLSGRLPESNSIEEFAQQLFDGVDLVTADDRRWTPGKYNSCVVIIQVFVACLLLDLYTYYAMNAQM